MLCSTGQRAVPKEWVGKESPLKLGFNMGHEMESLMSGRVWQGGGECHESEERSKSAAERISRD